MQTEKLSVNTRLKSRRPFSMSKKGEELAETCVTSKILLVSLCDNQCFSDAIMLLSYTMPNEMGIKWGLACVRANSRTDLNSPAINAAETWINDPTEDNRTRILPNNSLYQPSAATWIAMAIYWAGGSIGDLITNEKAPDDLVNDSIFSSIMLSIKEIDEDNRDFAYSESIASGIRFLYG